MIVVILGTGLTGVILGYWLCATLERIGRESEAFHQELIEESRRAWYRRMRPEEFDPVQLDDDASEGWKK